MAFGILEDHKLDTVPGTGLLSARNILENTDETRELKRGTGRHSQIVLIPQPSDDPRDPLNWPTWKKEACFWTLLFAASLSDVLSPFASPAYVLLAKEFHVSVDEVASCFSAGFGGIAAFALVLNPLAFKYGHRIVYLLSTFLMFITCIWTALSPNLTSIRASRVFQGFGQAAPQCLVATTIEHLYFVHERGFRSSTWYFARVGASTVGPVIGSYMIQKLSWQLLFWFTSIACGLAFVGVFFVVPETTYRRPGSPVNLVSTKNENITDTEALGRTTRTSPTSDVNISSCSLTDKPSPHPGTFLSQLRVYDGTFSDESLWRMVLRPFPFILSPVTWFIFLAFGLPTVWLAFLNLSASTIFTIKYGFDASQVGLTHLAGLVGVVLATCSTVVNDRVIIWMSQRNRGIYEPEFRLVFMPSMLFGLFTFIGWAVGNEHGMPWIGAVACYMMLPFSLVVSGGAAVAYLLDTHGANSLHILTLNHVSKDMLAYGSTFFANGFILSRGVNTAFFMLAGCQAVCWLVTIPMYVYGKRVRSFIARHPRLFHGDVPAPGASPSAATPQSASARSEGTPTLKV